MLRHLRAKQASDEPFIYNSWLRSHRDGNHSGYMSNTVYYDNHKLVIKDILNTAKTVMLVNPDDSDHIFGYLCFDDSYSVPIIHYCYIKEPFRKFGLASNVVKEIFPEANEIFVTHATSLFSEIEKRFNVIFNPYLIYKRFKV